MKRNVRGEMENRSVSLVIPHTEQPLKSLQPPHAALKRQSATGGLSRYRDVEVPIRLIRIHRETHQ